MPSSGTFATTPLTSSQQGEKKKKGYLNLKTPIPNRSRSYKPAAGETTVPYCQPGGVGGSDAFCSQHLNNQRSCKHQKWLSPSLSAGDLHAITWPGVSPKNLKSSPGGVSETGCKMFPLTSSGLPVELCSTMHRCKNNL